MQGAHTIPQSIPTILQIPQARSSRPPRAWFPRSTKTTGSHSNPSHTRPGPSPPTRPASVCASTWEKWGAQSLGEWEVVGKMNLNTCRSSAAGCLQCACALCARLTQDHDVRPPNRNPPGPMFLSGSWAAPLRLCLCHCRGRWAWCLNTTRPRSGPGSRASCPAATRSSGARWAGCCCFAGVHMFAICAVLQRSQAPAACLRNWISVHINLHPLDRWRGSAPSVRRRLCWRVMCCAPSPAPARCGRQRRSSARPRPSATSVSSCSCQKGPAASADCWLLHPGANGVELAGLLAAKHSVRAGCRFLTLPALHLPAVVYGADKTKWSGLKGALRRGEFKDGPVTLVVERRPQQQGGAA